MSSVQNDLDKKSMIALIEASPLDEEQKQKMIALMPKMDEEQKLRILNIVYTSIAYYYGQKVNKRFEEAIAEMADGQKQYSKEDFDRIETEVWDEFFKKESLISDEVSLSHIRESLKALQNKLQ